MATRKKVKASYTEDQKQEVRDFIEKWIKDNGKERGSMTAAVEHFQEKWGVKTSSLAQTFTSWVKGGDKKPSGKSGSGNGGFLDKIALIKKKAGKLSNLRDELDDLISAINSL